MVSEVLKYERHPGVKNLFFNGEVLQDVGIGDYRLGTANLATVAASTCIVMVAHNERMKRGLLGHFSSVTEESREGHDSLRGFDEALDKLGTLGEPEATSIWLGGGTPHVQEGVDQADQDRTFVYERVRQRAGELGISEDDISVAWSGPERIIDVELDCQRGILVAHDYPEA